MADVQRAHDAAICCPCCERVLTEAQIRSILGQFARSKLAPKGYSRFAKMTPEQRSAEAKKAAQTRWLRRNSQVAGKTPIASS
jgi:hypothetical protein